MTALTTTTSSALTATATAIHGEHEAAQRCASEAVAHAIRCGELLIEAKAALPHGDFGAWLAANVAFSGRTARGYMRLAGMDEAKRQRVADMSLREAIASIAERPKRKATGYRIHFDQRPPTYALPLELGGSFSANTEDGRLISVNESAQHPGFWFVGAFDSGRGLIEGWTRPVHVDAVCVCLDVLRVSQDAYWFRDAKAGPIEAPLWSFKDQPETAYEAARAMGATP